MKTFASNFVFSPKRNFVALVVVIFLKKEIEMQLRTPQIVQPNPKRKDSQKITHKRWPILSSNWRKSLQQRTYSVPPKRPMMQFTCLTQVPPPQVVLLHRDYCLTLIIWTKFLVVTFVTIVSSLGGRQSIQEANCIFRRGWKSSSIWKNKAILNKYYAGEIKAKKKQCPFALCLRSE